MRQRTVPQPVLMPGKGVMETIRSIVARVPQRELDLRRRCASDARFRSICSDYEEAAAALRYWQSLGSAGKRMAAEYADFLAELESEILDQLDRSVTNTWRS